MFALQNTVLELTNKIRLNRLKHKKSGFKMSFKALAK